MIKCCYIIAIKKEFVMENKENKPQINESNAAKRLEGLGVSMDENIHLESDKAVKGSFWGNIWYRNKWAIIIGSIMLVTVIVLCFALCGKDTPELNVMYVGPTYMVNNAESCAQRLNEIYAEYEDEIGFPTLVYQSEEERERLKKEAPERLLNESENLNALNQFQMQAMGGEIVIYLIDPALYMHLEGACTKISDVLGYELSDELMYNDYAVNFSKTDFAKYFDEFDALPENTIVCIVKTAFTSDENYSSSCELFKKIVEFQAP